MSHHLSSKYLEVFDSSLVFSPPWQDSGTEHSDLSLSLFPAPLETSEHPPFIGPLREKGLPPLCPHHLGGTTIKLSKEDYLKFHLGLLVNYGVFTQPLLVWGAPWEANYPRV